MAAVQPQFSPRQVALALGVSESSVKRWCDCGAIAIVKTSGGHRKITLESLQCFMQRSQRCLSFPNELGLPRLLPSRSVCIEGVKNSSCQQFRDGLAGGDEDLCRNLIQQMIAEGALQSEAAQWLITDAMHGVGRAWDCQHIDIYQERRACEIALRLIFELRHSLPAVAPDAPLALGGSPQGDPYQLPNALVELTLREAGWNTTSLGNHLPLSSFVQAAADCRPDLIWLSVSVIEEQEQFVSEQIAMADGLGGNTALVVGGRALTETIRARLQYTAYCHSLSNLPHLARLLCKKSDPISAAFEQPRVMDESDIRASIV